MPCTLDSMVPTATWSHHTSWQHKQKHHMDDLQKNKAQNKINVDMQCYSTIYLWGLCVWGGGGGGGESKMR